MDDSSKPASFNTYNTGGHVYNSNRDQHIRNSQAPEEGPNEQPRETYNNTRSSMRETRPQQVPRPANYYQDPTPRSANSYFPPQPQYRNPSPQFFQSPPAGQPYYQDQNAQPANPYLPLQLQPQYQNHPSQYPSFVIAPAPYQAMYTDPMARYSAPMADAPYVQSPGWIPANAATGNPPLLPMRNSPTHTPLVQSNLSGTSIGQLPLTLPAVGGMLMKQNLASPSRDPAEWERVEQKFIADILTWMSMDSTSFHESLRTHMKKMANEIPKVHRRFFIYQLAYIALYTHRERDPESFCTSHLDKYGHMDGAALLAKQMDVMDDIQDYYKCQMTFGSQPDYATIDEIQAIDAIGISVQSRLAKTETCNQTRSTVTLEAMSPNV